MPFRVIHSKRFEGNTLKDVIVHLTHTYSPMMQSMPFSSGNPFISLVATKNINSEPTIVYISCMVKSDGRRVPIIGLSPSICYVELQAVSSKAKVFFNLQL